jgi:hypothetical protein
MNINGKREKGRRAGRRAGGASRRGIALVITLIMLSVTLVMAIAFLALARRERSSVSTGTDTTTAKLAADSALAAAQAQIMANLLTTNTALYNFGLLVSTNYINTNGFDPGVANPTNVNYDHQINSSAPLTAVQFVQNVANLQFLPRAPVFIQTNAAGSNDFRFYLDLNRNGEFDPTAFIDNSVTNGPLTEVGDPQWIGVLARPDAMHSADNQFVSRYAFIAVPVGNTLDINAIHNQAATPNTVDDASSQFNTGSTFIRNEGVGSWEINLAAFLTDLNYNQWDPQGAGNEYTYGEYEGDANSGAAFQDALSILSYRYNYNYGSLYLLSSLYPNNYQELEDQPFDLFPVGLLTSTEIPNYANVPSDPVKSDWAGSVNTNHFYDLPSELFNPLQSSTNFTGRLLAAGNNITNYDRYTYYRLLSQLGTDSDPDDGKMNLNFKNITNGVVVPGMETNLYHWAALDFFTNAADRMLRLYTTNWFYSAPTGYLATYYGITNNYSYYYTNGFGVRVVYDPGGFGLTNVSGSHLLGWTNTVPAFGITNIPVYVNGRFVYSPAVNRILQLAANLYDASTNSFYPDVFRPILERDNTGTNIFIVGFTNLSRGLNTISGVNDPQLSTPYNIWGLTNLSLAGQFAPGGFTLLYSNQQPVNAYGVPWIIGAKKGFPSFNKFGMQSVVQVTRKLQVRRSTIPTVLGTTTFLTNQLIAFSVSNYLNAECWNSYSNVYENPINIYALDTISMALTNNDGLPTSYFYNYQLYSNTYVPRWPGFTNAYPTPLSFTNPLSGVVVLLTNSDLYFGIGPPGLTGFYPDSLGYGWESNNYSFTFPQFGLTTTNDLQLYMYEQASGHLIDYVQLGGPQTSVNLTEAIETNNPEAVGYGSNMWSQVFNRGVPYGILNQIVASENSITANNGTAYWANTAANQEQVDGFASFMGVAEPYATLNQSTPGIEAFTTNYVVQAPYTPTATISMYTSWQANDPLVHYLASDLTFNGTEKTIGIPTGVQTSYGAIGYVLPRPAFNVVNDRYQPWGTQNTNGLAQVGPNAVVEGPYSLAFKDPLVWGSDYWGFPTNLYPTVGWMGRVHRGTPWQTVYLKAHDVLHVLDSTGDVGSGTNTWANWTGNNSLVDLANSAPVQDRLLFDLFTTRFNDNAVRGTLSVNQTNLAAWSAVLSGMVVLTNVANFPSFATTALLAPSNSWQLIEPAAVNGVLQTMVTNINFARASTNLPYNLSYGFTNADGLVGAFEHAGDILAVPALTESSPFLNWSNVQQEQGISDATYEWLPQQMMGLVRESSTPRYVIYCYGQTLRPAPGGLVTGSTDFGMITNYQVVAESAVRAVVTVQKQVNMSGPWPVTNYTTRVESYNVLPPE